MCHAKLVILSCLASNIQVHSYCAHAHQFLLYFQKIGDNICTYSLIFPISNTTIHTFFILRFSHVSTNRVSLFTSVTVDYSCVSVFRIDLTTV